jgi:peptide/nickel transport system ATP-binding protein
MAPVFEFANLSLAINGKPVLDGVTLAMDAGETLGLVGRSGSGKSMTALAAMRLPPAGSTLNGAIKLNGENLLDKTERQMCDLRGRDIAMIFQEPMTALNPLHSIGAQIAETILIHSGASSEEALTEASALLDRVGLSPDTAPPTRFPYELSGGQRQRVMIAIAIAMKPTVLIADEPTTALDVTTQADILSLLRRLTKEDGIALILITHDLAVIANMADRIAVMKEGRIVEQNTPERFFDSDHASAARELLAQPIQRIKSQPPIDEPGKPTLDAVNIVCPYSLPRRSLFSAPETFRAVDGVSLSVRKGENIGLVGGSGCGKSTLARALLGLTPNVEGQIRIDGEPFPNADAKLMRRLRRKIQIVFQDPYSSFNPRQKIEKIIAEPLSLYDDPPTGADRTALVAEALTAVDLMPEDAQKYPHEFSGGQRQRIAIARALITHPEIIIFDEATSALDVASRNRVFELLMRLSSTKDMSYMFITHDLTVIRDITDRLLVMQAGRIVEEGETDEIFNDPKHEYTKSLIAAAPVIKYPLGAFT